MGSVYKSAFVIPTTAATRLTDAGWEFDSNERLPNKLIDDLTKKLSLRRMGSFLGMDVFEGKDVKLTVSFDSAGGIEHLFVQLHGNSPDDLLLALEKAAGARVRVFVPRDRD
jgi:hypothetical protein